MNVVFALGGLRWGGHDPAQPSGNLKGGGRLPPSELGRKRRKELKVVRRRLPSIFNCPNCGVNSVSVEIEGADKRAVVKCGSCGLAGEFQLKNIQKKIDAYNMFVDSFFEKSGAQTEVTQA